MKLKKWTSLISFFALLWSTLAFAQIDRNSAAYNLEAGLALKGYDPVSYFAEGGSLPQKGKSTLSIDYKGVTYFFANNNNREVFKTMPERYEPTYGGFCAWAMANGSAIDIIPDIFTINGNRLHLFFSKRAKRNFDRDVTKYESMADSNWKSLSGESPRL
jgi:YHS domain-containing protein